MRINDLSFDTSEVIREMAYKKIEDVTIIIINSTSVEAHNLSLKNYLSFEQFKSDIITKIGYNIIFNFYTKNKKFIIEAD